METVENVLIGLIVLGVALMVIGAIVMRVQKNRKR